MMDSFFGFLECCNVLVERLGWFCTQTFLVSLLLVYKGNLVEMEGEM